MPRLLHMADVHLGARHHDLGGAAQLQRERQFAAFRRSLDLAIAERVDLVLIAGDLFDSNTQPRRSVERAAGELKRLAASGIRSVLIPGTHDCYEPGSIYRAFDLGAMAGGTTEARPVVLTPDRSEVVFPELDIAVYGFVFPAKTAPESPLAGFSTPSDGPRWRVGLIHGSIAIANLVEQDDVLFTEGEIGASGLDYLALGHWHSFRQGRAGRTTWAYAGAPEPVAVDQDGAGNVLLVALQGDGDTRRVNVEPRAVGRTRFQKVDVDAAGIESQDALCRRLATLADPDLVLDVRVVGIASPDLEIHDDEVDAQLASGFLKFRFRNLAVAALPDDPLPPPDTIEGAFRRDLEARIQAAEAAGATDVAAEHREALRLGRQLLEDPKRVTLV